MTTVADLIQETRRHLVGDSRFEFNKLNGSLDGSTDQVVCEFDLAGIVPGSYICIEDELMYVWSVDTGTKTATVERGVLGSTATTHADNLLVEVNPRFDRFTIKEKLKQEILSWPSEVYAVDTVDINAAEEYWAQGIDLGVSSITHILQVRHKPDTIQDTNLSNYSQNWPTVKFWDLVFNPPSDMAANHGLVINERVPTGTIHVVYAKPFDVSTFDDATDVEVAVGLATSQIDIASIGAAWRLMTTREIARTDMRARRLSRDEDGVPPNFISNVTERLKQVRDKRIGEEMQRLRHKYGWPHT